jgi:hypothetical protein
MPTEKEIQQQEFRELSSSFAKLNSKLREYTQKYNEPLWLELYNRNGLGYCFPLPTENKQFLTICLNREGKNLQELYSKHEKNLIMVSNNLL